MKATPKHKTINALLNHSFLWRASHACHHDHNNQHIISTGFNKLDQQLACGGWPLGQFIECLLPGQNCQGLQQEESLQRGKGFQQAESLQQEKSPQQARSLQRKRRLQRQKQNSLQPSTGGFPQLQGLLHIFLPAIRALTHCEQQSQAPVLLINPPCQPYLPGWFEHADKALWVVRTSCIEEQLWATEHALKSNASSVVMSWLPYAKQPISALRKLQLAARRSQSLFIGIRDITQQHTASPAQLRITLQATRSAHAEYEPVPNKNNRQYTQLAVHIVKQPGSWGGQTVRINWHSSLQHPMESASHWPIHYPNAPASITEASQVSSNRQRLHGHNPDTRNYS